MIPGRRAPNLTASTALSMAATKRNHQKILRDWSKLKAEIPPPKSFNPHHRLQPQTSPKIATDCMICFQYHQEAEVSIAQIQAHRRQAPVVIKSRDTFTQIVHTLPPPPAPNIPQNPNRLHGMCPADNQEAEVSIGHKLAHRKQALVLLESRDTFQKIRRQRSPLPRSWKRSRATTTSKQLQLKHHLLETGV